MSPSTVMQLKVASLARLTIACSSPGATAASENRIDEHRRHVGRDHPRALGEADDRHRHPASSTFATAPLGKVSVVMIARAARSAAPGIEFRRQLPEHRDDPLGRQRLADHPGRGDEDVASGTPSAARRRRDGRMDGRAPGAAGEGVGVPRVDQDGEARRRPAPPRSAASLSSHQSTGAERVADRVNTPAIEAPASIAASITSSRPR